jgi:TRAP-type mannitol/chloroaromatic compound transport system permease small subunit
MDKHVRVDLFYSNYSPKTKAIVDVISQLFLILPFVLLILYVSFDYISLSYNQNEISPDPGGLAYRWAIKSMMVVGFVLLGLQSLAEIVKNLKIIKAER